MRTKVSAESALLKFIPCGPQCHTLGCKAPCCDSSKGPAEVYVHPDEWAGIEAHGVKVDKSKDMIVPGCDGKCPFKDGPKCSLYGKAERPLGCIASPFQLMKRHDTLIIRNRYKLLPCYRHVEAYPHLAKPDACEAFRDSLVVMFGEQQTADIIEQVKAGTDYDAEMDFQTYEYLKLREDALHA